MSAKLITCIAVLLILSLIIVPSTLLAEEEYLKLTELNFFNNYMPREIKKARNVVVEWKKVVGSSWDLQDTNPYVLGTGHFPKLENCYMNRNEWPDTVSDIIFVWNNEVCKEFDSISQKAKSIEEAISIIKKEPIKSRVEYTTGVFIIRGSLSAIESSLSKIEGMMADLMDKLRKLRKSAKELEKEAKKDLGLKGDFCFIATAAYGTPTAKEIDELRHFRDEYLRKSSLGNDFIKFYYANSPPIAKFISEHEILRVIVREGFVDPVVKIVELTENYWSE
jgi:hypothetical protein